MRDYYPYWVDDRGVWWPVPRIRGRLKPGKIPLHRRLRAYVLRRDGHRCRECGCDDRAKLVADHILSRRNGGPHHPDNLRALCDSCNARKAALVDRRGR